MPTPRLLVGLASVFAGLSVVLSVLGVVYTPVALVVAVPFWIVTYLLWYHVSGRLGRRVRRQARTVYTTRRHETGGGGFGERAREEWTGSRESRGFDGGTRQNWSRGRPTRTTTEAYRVLGLDPGASEAAVRSAYREKVKQVHPDTEDGDERRFRRVNEAYERLTE